MRQGPVPAQERQEALQTRQMCGQPAWNRFVWRRLREPDVGPAQLRELRQALPAQRHLLGGNVHMRQRCLPEQRGDLLPGGIAPGRLSLLFKPRPNDL
jgi:hypothetical protein